MMVNRSLQPDTEIDHWLLMIYCAFWKQQLFSAR